MRLPRGGNSTPRKRNAPNNPGLSLATTQLAAMSTSSLLSRLASSSRIRLSRWRPQSASEGDQAEAKLLTLAQNPLERVDVPVGPGKQDYIHTVLGGDQSKPALVMAPGYAAGLGFYWRNFDGLGSHFRLHAFDWLGTGLSGRPPFTVQGREQVEDFFLESMNEWRKKMGLEKFILLGHSLGGYLSAAYALKYPQHVQHLVLVCPAGVPQVPEDWHTNFLKNASGTRKALFKSLMWMWEKGVTPGSVVRTLGPMGPGLISRYVNGRFSNHGQPLTEQERELFRPYFYQIMAAPGSGEYALRHLLAPGAWAHAPLEKRLHELQVPVTFIYGETDWMRPEHAVKLCQRLKADRTPLDPSDMKVEIIGDAGHFAFLEQPELFDRAVVDACATILGRAEEQRAATAMRHADEQSRSADASEWKYRPDAPPATGHGAAETAQTATAAAATAQ